MDDTVIVDDGETPAPLLSQPGTPLVSIATPLPKAAQHLKVTKQNVRFPGTTVSETAGKISL